MKKREDETIDNYSEAVSPELEADELLELEDELLLEEELLPVVK